MEAKLDLDFIQCPHCGQETEIILRLTEVGENEVHYMHSAHPRCAACHQQFAIKAKFNVSLSKEDTVEANK